MPRIADYLIVADNKFEISRSSDGGFNKTFDFDLDAGGHLPSRSILAFVVFVHDNAKDLKFEVKLNGSSQLNYTFSFQGSGQRINSLHEVIDANVLKHGSNTIEFHPMSGTGKIEFGDVVLLYQRDI